jgi:alkylated DNA repair dioxygenase AlkB
MDIYSTPEKDGTHSVFISIENLLTDEEIEDYFQKLEAIEHWHGGTAFDKKIAREQRWYHVDDKPFSPYWGGMYIRWKPNEYEDWLLELQGVIETRLNAQLEDVYPLYPGFRKVKFNSVLINKYSDGQKFIKPHKDDEQIFNSNPTIVSLSFGATRKFTIKRVIYDTSKPKSTKLDKDNQDMNRSFDLTNGQVMIMGDSSQRYFSHEVEKDDQCDQVRYNLTFRFHDPVK